MKVLVTGGAGFIGSHLVRRLLGAGNAVTIYDNFTSGKRQNLAGIERDVEVVEADVRDAPRLDHAIAGCELVYHEAAIVSVPYSVEHPQETHDVNLQGTLNVLTSACRRGVRRVVFASSAAIYGEDPELPKRESMRGVPVSPYGVEKLASENYLMTWSKLFGVETVALRYFNVFGPRQDPSSPYSGVISVFVTRALASSPITIYGDGEQTRDFVYVDNVVDANVLAGAASQASGQAYNVGCGKKTTLNELLAMVGAACGKTLVPTHGAPRAGDIRDSVADISRARAELGYAPKVEVAEGLRRLIDFRA